MKSIKGFTMVELMIALGISIIVIMISFTLIFTITRNLNTQLDYTDTRNTVNEIYDFMEKKLKFAEEISVYDALSSATSDYPNVFFFKDDRTHFNGSRMEGQIVDPTLIINHYVTVNDDTIKLKLELIKEDGRHIYSVESTFTVDNLRYSHNEIEAVQGKLYKNPKIYFK